MKNGLLLTVVVVVSIGALPDRKMELRVFNVLIVACWIYLDTVDGSEILHQLGCIKTYKQWDIYHINWFSRRISAINSSLYTFLEDTHSWGIR